MSQTKDFCEHDNMHAETVTTNYISNDGGVGEYDTEIYVCDDCGADIDPDTASPVLDRQEAEAEYNED